MCWFQLAAEGRINSDVVSDDNNNDDDEINALPQKRGGRFQGFCFRKTNTGRFLPYVCWKNGAYDVTFCRASVRNNNVNTCFNFAEKVSLVK